MVEKEPELNQSYRMLHPRHKYHILVVSLLDLLIAIVLLRVPFPQSLSLVVLLAIVIYYFAVSEKFYCLLPIAILGPPYYCDRFLSWV